MRINKYVALATTLSRRQADDAIAAGRVVINGEPAHLGSRVGDDDTVELDGTLLTEQTLEYVLINKPVNYVCSRTQQDDKPTIYSLLPKKFHHLQVAGRLDADSHGLVLLTNDGDFANQMMHPSTQKTKIYDIELSKNLDSKDKTAIQNGIELEDGSSQLGLEGEGSHWQVTMHEGRNRQIRRTFAAKGYDVIDLKRIAFGPYSIDDLGDLVYNIVDKRT